MDRRTVKAENVARGIEISYVPSIPIPIYSSNQDPHCSIRCSLSTFLQNLARSSPWRSCCNTTSYTSLDNPNSSINLFRYHGGVSSLLDGPNDLHVEKITSVWFWCDRYYSLCSHLHDDSFCSVREDLYGSVLRSSLKAHNKLSRSSSVDSCCSYWMLRTPRGIGRRANEVYRGAMLLSQFGFRVNRHALSIMTGLAPMLTICIELSLQAACL